MEIHFGFPVRSHNYLRMTFLKNLCTLALPGLWPLCACRGAVSRPECFSLNSLRRFLFAGGRKLWRSRFFAAVEFVNCFGGSFDLFRRNPDKTFFLVDQVGYFTGFAVDDPRGLRRRIDPFFVPFYFHGHVPILAGAFNSLDNGEIATRGNE